MIDKVQKIREEVERMHNLLPIMDGDNISVNYADRICTTLEMYIDSLQEEPVGEDLEEAAKLHVIETRGDDVVWDENAGCAMLDFKSGAKWQKQKDSVPAKGLEEVISYLSKRYPEVSFAKLSRIAVYVAKWQKEQMMKEAFDGEVGYWNLRGLSVNVELPHSVEEGDKVKVIVIKED